MTYMTITLHIAGLHEHFKRGRLLI